MTPLRRRALLAALRARRRRLRDLAARDLALLEAREAELRSVAERCRALMLAGPSAPGTTASLLAAASLRQLLARAAADGADRAAHLSAPIRAARQRLAEASAALKAAEEAEAAARRDSAARAEAATFLDLPMPANRRPAP